jgi:hypothetical protein
MPQIAELITSLEQELELRIEWLENGLKEIANGRDDMNPIYVKQQAQSILDGEPTTADEHNTMQEDEIENYEDFHTCKHGNSRASNCSDCDCEENTVLISDINKEIAIEWNRDREKRINKEKEK